jgi:hypothetical protein
MRTISQEEAVRMRDTLKTIAGFRNPGVGFDGGQVAAQRARNLLDELGLFGEGERARESPELQIRSGTSSQK